MQDKRDLLRKRTLSKKYTQGFFRPLNPKKYAGDPKTIMYMSHWEFCFMRRLDNDPNVVQWGSEEFAIPYKSPKDGRMHRYFPDFIYKTKDGKTFFIEIKPNAQSKRPKNTKKKPSKRLLNEQMTYAINMAKWAACREFCDKHGYMFQVLGEKELGIGK